MRFGIVGIGPIGGLLAAHLIRAGHKVTLIDIAYERLEAMRERGIQVLDPREQMSGDFSVTPHFICPGLGQLADLGEEAGGEVDVLVIAVKTYILERLLPELKEVHRPGLKVISYQNGLDCEELLAEAVGAEDVLRVVVNYAGGLKGDNGLEVTFFTGSNRIGTLDPTNVPLARELAELFTAAGMNTEYTDNIKLHEWQKVVLNAALAPVTALTGLTMKETMDHPQLREIVATLLREGIEEAAQVGLDFPADFFDHGMAYLEKGGYHKPSMLIDVELGLPTEIDALNGKIAEYGRSRDAARCNRTITALIKGLEARNRNLRNQNQNQNQDREP